ncbi:MAG TPA: TIGR03089 family protein [Pedococcus sp.]
MPTPPDVLAAMLRSDPGRPRITCYDDTPGPTSGERIELSAKVLANWANKAANALQEEWDLGPGSTVRLALPPHWRTLYWALATWSIGATVVLDDEPTDLLVTDERSRLEDSTPAVLVTLAGLARSAPDAVPPGAMDEARELSTYADQFAAWDEPAPNDPALRAGGEDTAYGAVVPQRDWPRGVRLHTPTSDTSALLADALGAWALDGSLVLSRGPAPDGRRAARLESEGVTVAL